MFFCSNTELKIGRFVKSIKPPCTVKIRFLDCLTFFNSLLDFKIIILIFNLFIFRLVKLKRGELSGFVSRCRTKHVYKSLSSRIFKYGNAMR